MIVVDIGVHPATGKRKQLKRRGFRTKKAAETALNTILRDIERGDHIEPSTDQLTDFLEVWLRSTKPTVRDSTWNGYAHYMRAHVIPRIGALELRAVDAPTLNGLYADLLVNGRLAGKKKGSGLSTRTVNAVHKILHRALSDAVRWGKLSRNPADYADPPKPRSREMRVWTTDQLRTFLVSCDDDRLRCCWVLAASTGMRRGELLGLQWSDIDFAAGQMAIRRSRVAVRYDVVEGEPKSGRARTVAIDDGTVAELRAHRTRQLEERLSWGEAWIDTGLVFTREDGSPLHPHSAAQFFEVAVTRAKVPPLTLHGLRHTHATLGLAAGVPAKVMQERLGHSSIAITLDLYTHVVAGMQEEAAAKVGALIFGVADDA
jgi:integrase